MPVSAESRRTDAVLLGGEMKLVVIEGQGHNMWSGWFQCQELVDFVIAQAKNRSNAGKGK